MIRSRGLELGLGQYGLPVTHVCYHFFQRAWGLDRFESPSMADTEQNNQDAD
jgi:hypothetical protein